MFLKKYRKYEFGKNTSITYARNKLMADTFTLIISSNFTGV